MSFPLKHVLAALALLLAAAHPASASDNKQQPAASPSPAASAPQVPGAPAASAESAASQSRVTVGDITVLDQKVGFGSLSPEERARFVSDRLLALARSDASLDALRLRKGDEGYKVVLGDSVLLIITPADASAAQTDLDQLARETFDATARALRTYRESRSLKSILIGVALSVTTLLGLVLAIALIRRGFTRLDDRLHHITPRLGAGLRIKNVQLLTAQQIEGVLRRMLRGLRLLLILLCLYFFIPLILSFFSVTRAIGRKVFNLFVTPLETLAASFIAYIPNFFYIVVICIVAYYVVRGLRYFFELIGSGDLKLDFFYPEWAIPTYQIARAVVIVMAVISAFPYVPGSSSAAFQGVGLVLGLLVSFASSSAISNVIAGVILVYTRAFQIGDRISVADTTGDVVEKTLLVTRVKTPKNVVVTIPNSLVLGSHIVNFSSTRLHGDAPLIIHTTVTIGYDVPWTQVQALLIDAARRTEGLERTPDPFVLQTALNDFYVAYEINAYTRLPRQMARLYSDLHRHIQDTFNEAGVEIMSPHYQTLRDGNASTVPSVLGQPGYQAHHFGVEVAHPTPPPGDRRP